MLIEKVVTILIIIWIYLFILLERVELKNDAKDMIENVNEHNKQLEMMIYEMQE